RKASSKLAYKLREITNPFLSKQEKVQLSKCAQDIISSSAEPTPLSEELSECVRYGTAFHHAGLSNEQRKIIEDAFKKQRLIKCIVATPTLAAGVNIPARRVIIRDLWRYDQGIGMHPIPVLEYKQQAGRAGRPRFDREGEAITIARNKTQRRKIFENYIFAEPEPIYSKLGVEPILRFHILASIASGFTPDMESLLDFISTTFYAYQRETHLLEETIDDVIDFLDANGFIEVYEGRLNATVFGQKTSKLYIDPLTALQLKRAVLRYSPEDTTSVSIFHAICSTPDMRSLYMRGEDGWVEEKFRDIKKKLLLPTPEPMDEDYGWFLSNLKTAYLMEDWINELPEAEICSRYGVGPGDIRNIVETAEWLLHAMREIARMYRFDMIPELTDLILRVKHGCKKELLDLVRLKNIGRVRARALYAAGFKTINSLRGVPVDRLAQIPSIGKKIALSIKKQIGEERDKDLMVNGK
ncbi:MAG TPA: ATP-dependent DNA helicase, partial [Thermoplasmatales archaeon]|nr:ATP-dependent DNA helicase [Thermoplasmatales archaeon]